MVSGSRRALRVWLLGALALVLVLTGCAGQLPSKGAPPKGAPPAGFAGGQGQHVPDDGVHPDAISRTEVFWSGGQQVEVTVHVGPVVRARSGGALQLRFEATGGPPGAAVDLPELFGVPAGDAPVDARILDADGLMVYEPMRLEGVTPLTRFLDQSRLEADAGPARWVGYYPMPDGPMHVLLPYFGLVQDVHVEQGIVSEVPGMADLLTDQIMTAESFPLRQHSEPAGAPGEGPGPVGDHDATLEVADPQGRYGSAAVRVEEVRRVGGLLVGRIEVQQVTADSDAPHGAAWAVHAGWLAGEVSDSDGADDTDGTDPSDAGAAPGAGLMHAADAPTLLVDGQRVFPMTYDVAGRPDEVRLMPLTDRMFGYEDLRGEDRSATATVVWPDVGGDVVTIDVPSSAAVAVDATGDAQPFRFIDVPVLDGDPET